MKLRRLRGLRDWLLLILPLLGAFVPTTLPAQADPTTRVVSALDTTAMWTHLRYLADDRLEGRGPGTRGNDSARAWIAARFAAAGLLPAGDRGTWFHAVPLRMTRVHRSAILVGGDSLAYGVDQLAAATGSKPELAAGGAAVFAGFGIVAPEQGWDDYRGRDVRGKVVIVLGGTPRMGDGPAFRDAARYGSRNYKAATAAERGAVATLVIHREEVTPFPWGDIRRAWDQERQVTSTDRPIVSGWLSAAAADRMLRRARLDLDRMLALSESRGLAPVDLPFRVEITVHTAVRTLTAWNVVARLPGTGTRAHEAVILGAHYDHLGIGRPERGDSIYNGAQDNASGTALLLAVAEAFARTGVRPDRSVWFVAFDAEETGFHGSRGWVARPPVPVGDMVAMLNFDATNLYGATRDASALGLRESSLDEVFARAARAEGLRVTTLPDSMESYFERSDQLPFAEAGVPALFLWSGYDFIGRPAGWAERMLGEYLAGRYHRPSDELRPEFTMAGALQQARVAARMIVELANAAGRPAWRPGSRFRP